MLCGSVVGHKLVKGKPLGRLWVVQVRENTLVELSVGSDDRKKKM
jgi:hypothetical protein